MGLSEFVKMVLEAVFDGDAEKEINRAQLRGATVSKGDYTGVGLYTKEEAPIPYLRHPQLEAGAGAILWLEEGKVPTLERYAYGGEWPKDESLFTICA
jgi:hypothetical protein